MVDKATLDGLRIARPDSDASRRGTRWWLNELVRRPAMRQKRFEMNGEPLMHFALQRDPLAFV